MLSFFPRGVLDGILNLIESVSEGFPSYSYMVTTFHKHMSAGLKKFDINVTVTTYGTTAIFLRVRFSFFFFCILYGCTRNKNTIDITEL